MQFNLFSALTAAAALLAAGAAHAGDTARPRAVVELFTSQGCTSCPPADKVFIGLAESGDVVALSYHVDYWDYLGWRDTLASEANTARQHAYGRSFGTRSVYTPQAVVNGRVHMSGAQDGEIRGAIDTLAASGKGLAVDVSASYSGESIVIRLGTGSKAAGTRGQASGGAADMAADKAHVVLAYFAPESTVAIDRGENSGRTVTYRNAVRWIQTVGLWHGATERLEVPVAEMEMRGAGGCAVLLQKVGRDGLPGPILGATLVSMSGS